MVSATGDVRAVIAPPKTETERTDSNFTRREKDLADWHDRLEKRQRELDEREKLLTTISAVKNVKMENRVSWKSFVIGFMLGLAAFYIVSRFSSEISFMRSDMPFQMQETAFEAIKNAFSVHQNAEDKIAHHLKAKFEKTYGGQWNCIVGTSFKFDNTHLAAQHRSINVKRGNFEVLLFQKIATNTPLNLEIYGAKMNHLSQNEAIELVTQALDKKMNNFEIARQLKTTFDKKHGSTWQCSTGTSLGFLIQHRNDSDSYFYFKIRQLTILLFKTN